MIEFQEGKVRKTVGCYCIYGMPKQENEGLAFQQIELSGLELKAKDLDDRSPNRIGYKKRGLGFY